MRNFIIGSIIIGVFFILSSTTLPQEETTTWNMKAQMVVADTCQVSCPCLFGLEPQHGHCRFVGGVKIIKGKYGNVSLDGVTWGYLGEFTGSVKAGTQKWLYTAYYIDKNASKEQQQALRSILSAPPFANLGEQLGIKAEVIKIEIPNEPLKPYTMSIGNLGSITVEPVMGNDPNTPQKVLNPVYPFPAKEITLGSAEGNFKDHKKSLDLKKNSGEISEFELSGVIKH
jgi:hypothetical protein